ncbi:MAG: DUF255 domain-containing protein [Armatimonadetes bacterium]|nr:DUF255 domain-containing protein [Armatimonadota bacterium]
MNRKAFVMMVLLAVSILAAAGFVSLTRTHEVSPNKPDTARHTNRLISESSPYLLQHAHNPVDWYPWGQEAFEKAKKEDKPVFLSVGYSSCHWCHVMESESFENEEIAKLLNEHFVCIKVDREERPDIDDIYMLATQLLTGSGGWPMSVFLTPEGKPFYAGTYFPRRQFESVLTQIADAYANRRKEVDEAADQITDRLRELAAGRFKSGPIPPARTVEDAVRSLMRRFDREHGGFSDKPKFPPYNDLRLLIDEYRRTKDDSALLMVTRTLDAMALGGVYDHLGGGFHRYSTDERWLVPHFEKMLYDNALLARVYADAWTITKNPLYRERATQTLDWVLREMHDKGGGFYSALDADSEGEEGKFYAWTKQEILRALGRGEGELFCRVYNIEAGGNFAEEASGRKTGSNIPYLKKPIDKLAAGMKQADLPDRMSKAHAKLLALRGKRVRPGLDDKVLTGWNGLMIGSLAFCGRVLSEPRYTKAGSTAADFILKHLYEKKLLRRYRHGKAGVTAFLDDYAYLSSGLLDLYDATRDEKWRGVARRLADEMLDRFSDPKDGGFYSTSEHHEEILIRLKDVYDSALPSSNGMASEVLLGLYLLTGEAAYKDEAARTIRTFSAAIQRSPASTVTLTRVLAAYHDDGGKLKGPVPAEQPPTLVQKGPVKASLTVPRVSSDGAGTLLVRVDIDRGWHINSHKPIQTYLIPTRVTVSGSGISAGEPTYPAGKLVTLGFSPERLSVYEGRVEIRVPFRVQSSGSVGGTRVAVRLNYQPCNDKTCLEPVDIELRAVIPLQR